MLGLLNRFFNSLPFLGLLFGALAFCASLTPSLLPRTSLYQGLLSGIALASGYGVGVFRLWLWDFLELPKPGAKLARQAKIAVSIFLVGLAGYVLWQATYWQNSVRSIMNMDLVPSARPWQVLGIAVISALIIIGIGKLLRLAMIRVSEQVNWILPRKISLMLSATVVVALVGLLVSGVLGRAALGAADASFRELDRVNRDGISQPMSPLATGSDASLVPWASIGAQGKDFLVTAPTKEQIQSFHNKRAKTPIRVYVGLRSASSPLSRAQLALEELKRVGAFERSVLVVATPTGTGWLDPAGVDTLEYLHAGDSAIVATQYSYLPSWQTLLVDPNRSRRSARALFNVVYKYWTTLPTDSRPQFYLFGLSLGALGSEASGELFEIFEDPTHGALWAGPPFASSIWPAVTKARNPDSPYWLPRFRDSRLIRFTNQSNDLGMNGAPWSAMRIVYLQHASDPMSFFSTDLLWKKPDWLSGPRGPDVSPAMQWFPVVTFLQLAFDLPMATTVPRRVWPQFLCCKLH